jgi:hypothetical protein
LLPIQPQPAARAAGESLRELLVVRARMSGFSGTVNLAASSSPMWGVYVTGAIGLEGTEKNPGTISPIPGAG